jgi:hypothetical protein
VDGRRSAITGTTIRAPAPPWWPWIVVAAPFALAAGLGLRAATPLAVVCAVATIVCALAFAADRYASAGTIVESANEVLLALAALAVLAFVRGPPAARWAAVAVVGTLGLFIGLTKFTALTRGVVLAALPATLTRVLVVVALGAGIGAVALATRFFLEAEVQTRT